MYLHNEYMHTHTYLYGAKKKSLFAYIFFIPIFLFRCVRNRNIFAERTPRLRVRFRCEWETLLTHSSRLLCDPHVNMVEKWWYVTQIWTSNYIIEFEYMRLQAMPDYYRTNSAWTRKIRFRSTTKNTRSTHTIARIHVIFIDSENWDI